ncbi:MAG: ATP phosphoribosyltransferase regulatory subunit [Clostridiales bacterium]|nr:ATP phosphoribosyltransferase regulatory subunit [Clostridiales bacterium]
MQRIFHTPEGVRDIYGEECGRKRRLQEQIHRVFRQYGYEDIETPTFEYFEVFSREVGTIPSKDLYKFFDREGNTLVLRPDFTPSVSRACATYFSPEQTPVSLCYTGNTFIDSSSLRGQLKENTQMGVEHIGDASPEADAEILALTVECLRASGLKDFQISVGQVDYFKSLLAEAGMDEDTIARLRELISQKNEFGVEEMIREQKLSGELSAVFMELPRMFGSVEVLEKAKALTGNPEALAAVARLEEIYEILKLYGCQEYISFDFGMLSKYRYYTGIIFQAYTYGTGEPLVKGGRYNELMKHFGRPASSIGFAIVVDNLLSALSRQNISLPGEPETVILSYQKEEREAAVREARRLRGEGKNVALRLEREAGEL